MTDKVTKVTLTAKVDEYIAQMTRAAAQTRETGTEAERLAQKSEALSALGGVAMTMGAAIAGGVMVAVNKFAEFDQAMSQVQADTHESAENMNLLRDAALGAGANTAFSATEAANAIDELAKAGVSTSDILGGALSGALDLAAAGGLGVAQAAEIAATALSTFGLSGSEMGHVSDLLAAGAGKAQGSVTDMSQALNQSALVAKNTGLSIDDTTGALAAFASNGLLGSDAGTSFKTMLQSLNPRSEKAATLMKDLGLSAYDSQGKFVGLTEYAGKLHDALDGMSAEQRNATLQTIFGADAIRAATVLYENGADGMQQWIDKVNDSGYAAKTAGDKQDNLRGEVEKLGGAFDTLFIAMGEGANGPARFGVRALTEFVDAANALPGPVKQGALVIGALTGAVLLAGGAYLIALPKIAAFKAAQEALNITAITGTANFKAFSATAKTVGKVAAVTLPALSIFGTGMNELNGKIELSDDRLKQFNSQTKDLSFDTINSQLQQGGIEFNNFGEVLESFYDSNFFNRQDVMFAAGVGIDSVTGGVLHLSDQVTDAKGKLSALDKQLSSMSTNDATDKIREYADALGGGKERYEQLLKAFPEYKSALIEQAEAAGQATDDQSLLNYLMGDTKWAESSKGAKDNADALGEVQSSAKATNQAISDLSEILKNFGQTTLDAREAENQFYDSLDKANKSLQENGKTLDVHTEKGRANRDALDGIAKSTSEWAQAAIDAKAPMSEVTGIVDQGRQKYVDMGVAMGMSRDEAQALADKVIVSAGQMTAATKNLDAAKVSDKGFEVTDEGTIKWTQKSLDALNGMGLPDKKLVVGSDTAAAFAGIEGVNVTKIDEKTSVITGDSEDAWRHIDEVNAAQTPGKTAWIWGNDGDAMTKIRTVNGEAVLPKSAIIKGDNGQFYVAWNQVKNEPNQTKYVNIVQRMINKQSFADGSPRTNWVEQANGGVLSYYAQGGLRPMSAKVAEMVPANTWRVIGDRPQGDEAFIPIDGSLRSRALLAETARRMALFADGGMAQYAQRGTVVTNGMGVAPVNIQLYVSGAQYSSPQALGEGLAVTLDQKLRGCSGE